MKIIAIINPISGIGPKSSIPSMLAKALQNTDHELFVVYTKAAGHGAELTTWAIDQGFGAVIAIGGDGTVNEIASAMIGSDLPLGIIPRGSGNGLARALGIPMTVGGAIKVILAGQTRRIDCCSANQNAFFCTCGVGFDAEVSDRFAKSTRRGVLQYVVSMIEEYVHYEPRKYTLTIDGRTIHEEAFLVAVANAPQYGNNAFIAPGASLDDGIMDVVIIAPLEQLEAPKLAIQLLTKNIGSNNKADRYSARSLTIERSTEGTIHLDGDPVRMGKKIEIRVHPSAIKIFAPIKNTKK